MLNEVTAAEGGIILFIDEMHTLVRAGKADGGGHDLHPARTEG